MTSTASKKESVFAASASSPGEAIVTDNSLQIRGDWTLQNYPFLQQTVAEASAQAFEDVDLSHLERLDTAGASQLITLLGPERLHSWRRHPMHFLPSDRHCSALCATP